MGVNHEGENLRNVSNRSHCEEEGVTLHVVRLPSWEVFKQGQVSHLFRPYSCGWCNVEGTF